MSASFFITLREGLEAALIIGIILGYLHKTGQGQFNRQVYLGAAGAVLASVLTAAAFESLLGGFEMHEELFEGIFMLLAVGMLTPMIIWMHNNSRSIKSNLERQVRSAVAGSQIFGLAAISFLSVYREGVETVLFMKAAALNGGSWPAMAGGTLGILAAVVLAVLIFRGTARLNLGTFFRVTGIILVFFAAGLTAHGIHELQEAGVLPVLIEHLWNTNGIINEKGLAGSFLKSLVGYNGDPSLLEVIGWSLYMAAVGRIFLKSGKPEQAAI
ncbi:MAG: FTR1 family iron permease [Desulfocucumaceae bacterium]